MTDRLLRYEQFSDAQIYKCLCSVYPALLPHFDQLAEMQAVRGFTDEELLASFRKIWPLDEREIWDEDNEFRGRLMLRAVHHLASGLRARRANAFTN